MFTDERYIEADDGVRLFCRIAGSGAQMVIIPNASLLSGDFRQLADTRTAIFYDMRNRGRSGQNFDLAQAERGIHLEVEDLEAVRRHSGAGEIDIVGHSYLGLMAILYAMRYPERVRRIVQIGAMQPSLCKQYPAHLTGADATLTEISARLAQVQGETGSPDFGRKWWSLMRQLFVADPADAAKLPDAAGDLPPESIANGMKHWLQSVLPSIRSLNLQASQIAAVTAPVLVIHGRRDRQSPYGGARDWAAMLPNARLLTVEGAAHVPWIEAPEKVFGAIRVFLDGGWPEGTESVTQD